MDRLVDYIKWMGDLSFKALPLNEAVKGFGIFWSDNKLDNSLMVAEIDKNQSAVVTT